MRKTFLRVIISVLLLTMILTGCGANTSKVGITDGKPIIIKVGVLEVEDSTSGKSVNVFKKYVEEKSEGKIKVETYFNGQLGGERQIAEGILLGTVQMGYVDAGVVANYEPSYYVLGMPYIFNSKEASYKAIDGELGAELIKRAESTGFKVLGFVDAGARTITTKTKAVNELADIKNLKIRVPESAIYLNTFKGFGANPTPMSFGEVYTGLQQGTIDGMENSIELLYTSKFMEVQDYMTLTYHMETELPLITSMDFFNSLPADLQKIVEEGAREQVNFAREELAKAEEHFIGKMKEEGITITELSPEKRAEFVEACKPVYDWFAKEYGQELIDLAQKYNN